MKMINATSLDRKSGERSGGTCGFFSGKEAIIVLYKTHFGQVCWVPAPDFSPGERVFKPAQTPAT